MLIWALDVASTMGVAAGEPGAVPTLSVVKLGRQLDDNADVFARAFRWITRRVLEHAPPDLVVLEQPLIKHNPSLLLGLRGVMLGALKDSCVPFIEVAPPTWRKFFIGAGHLKGPDAKAQAVALCERLGWGTDLDHNAAEAAGMWLWGCAQVAPRAVPRHEPLFLRGGNP